MDNTKKTKDTQPSRREFLGAAAVAVAAGVSACAPGESVTGGDIAAEPVLILINGRIHTMDAENSVASSVTSNAGWHSLDEQRS